MRTTVTGQKFLVRPKKLSQAKLYEYIKKQEVDGYPRVRAYAEAIDEKIYELTPLQQKKAIDYLRESREDYDLVKEAVLSENNDQIMRKSAVVQQKAIDLLNNVLDRANAIASDPNTDAKELNTAVQTLKTIMPALTAPKQQVESAGTDKKSRASRFIN